MKRVYRGAGLFVTGVLLTSSACAYGMGSGADHRRAHDPDGSVRLHVTNHSGGPMELFAMGSGTSYRVGTVHPGSPAISCCAGMIVNGAVELVARSGSSPLVRSGPLLLAPGSGVDFQLAASPVMSVATVRP